jgi:hypothetical protein
VERPNPSLASESFRSPILKTRIFVKLVLGLSLNEVSEKKIRLIEGLYLSQAKPEPRIVSIALNRERVVYQGTLSEKTLPSATK